MKNFKGKLISKWGKILIKLCETFRLAINSKRFQLING